MSTENTDIVESDNDVNLDDFSADFFGQKQADPAEPASSEVDEENDDQKSDAPNKDTQSNDAEGKEAEDNSEDTDTLADEDGDDNGDNDEGDNDDEDDSSGDDPNPKPKKNRFQERIDQLIKDREDEKRERLALQAKLEEVISKQNKDPEPTAEKEQEAEGEPTPTDLNEDGTEKYPLGEYDPNYIKDFMRYNLAQERKAIEAETKQEAEARQAEEARAKLQESWQEKVGPAQERYPDFQQKGEQLLETFGGIDQAYGEYLTSTLMSMDHGPDVLYYLANNTDEAQRIVNLGPQKATIALGRIESKFADADEQKQKARPKVSSAPNPPPVNKGSSPAVVEIADDTDDLDAFSRKLFKK